ncbi:MAG: hypothetical protein DRJ43_03205 [Thermoprotei archaeon]|nr:MAG: hypothetical protein DRJ43_03205 [Thermoprotei archaeon]
MGVNPFLDTTCFECMSRLALSLAKLVNQELEEAVLLAAKLMKGYSDAILAYYDDYVSLCEAVFDYTFKLLGDLDPYRRVKEASVKAALNLLPLAEKYASASNGLENSVKVAVAANALDFGTGVYQVDLEKFEEIFREKLREPLAVNDVEELEKLVENAETILYVLDNAGECVLDRPLVCRLARAGRVVVAARGGPVLNDATVEEAARAGLGEYADLITTGARLPCISLRKCDRRFLELLAKADVVVLKGQGNYQSFYNIVRVRRKPTFYLFTPKCRPVARLIKAPVGSLVAYRYR